MVEEPSFKYKETGCIRVLLRNRTNRMPIDGRYRYVDIDIKRFIIKNGFAQLWRLKSPKICGWQIGGPRELVV